MQKNNLDLVIAINKKTNLTVKLEESYKDKYNIIYYEKPSFFSSIFKKEQQIDIYIHQGSISNDALDMIIKAKLTIVNCIGLKQLIQSKLPTFNIDKVQIVYPYVIASKSYDKQIKKDFKALHDIKKEENIILFCSQDLNKHGIKAFLKLIDKLYLKEFVVVIESTTKEIDRLKMKINRVKVDYKMILLENYKDKDSLFIASDIFVLPTTQQLFIPNVLKAMYFKNAVFLPQTNFSAEAIDTFSVMRDIEDPTTSFRIDSVIGNKRELKKIQKENKEKVKDFTLENNLKVIKHLIENKL